MEVRRRVECSRGYCCMVMGGVCGVRRAAVELCEKNCCPPLLGTWWDEEWTSAITTVDW